MAKKKEEVAVESKKDKLAKIMKEINARVQNKDSKETVSNIHFGSAEAKWTKLAFGVPSVDELLGGGIPYGKFTTIWGDAGCGKTTLAYYLTASAQSQGKTVCYIALEAFDPDRAMSFGVDLDTLIVARFPKAEQSLDTIITMAKEKAVDVIILDSIHSLSPASEQTNKDGEDRSTESDTMALLARKLSQFFRMAVGPVYQGNVAVQMSGQTRTSVGFISFDKLSGGNALMHYSKLIVHIRQGQKANAPTEIVKEDGKRTEKRIGFETVITVTKNQVTGVKPEGTQIRIPYNYLTGFTVDTDSKVE